MREIKYIVFHCTATPQEMEVQVILSYWRNILKWKDPGYHFLIEKNGVIHQLQDLGLEANGVFGFNSNSIHISYIGGIDTEGEPLDNRTSAQIQSQVQILNKLNCLFPNAKILGHRDFPNVSKACPSFCVSSWLKSMEI